MSAPLYEIGNTLYLKESAALGFLEAVKIASAATLREGVWTYAIVYSGKLPTSGLFGDRIQYLQRHELYFNESEFVVECEAHRLVEEALQARLDAAQALRAARC